MVRRQHVQRSIFEMILPEGDQLWDPELRRIDEALEETLSRRRPKSRVRGRPGTPAAVVLRMLVLKHLYAWSFEDCAREVRGSLVYRAFCRLDCERVPDDKTLIRLAQALGPEVLKGIRQRLVQAARQRRVVRGWKLRVDTTVVETNIHHPTDSSLLGDGVRVITRTLHKIRKGVGKLRFRDRTRSVRRRVFEIAQQSRKLGEEAQGGGEGALSPADGDDAGGGTRGRLGGGAGQAAGEEAEGHGASAGARTVPAGETDERVDRAGAGADARPRAEGRYPLPQ